MNKNLNPSEIIKSMDEGEPPAPPIRIVGVKQTQAGGYEYVIELTKKGEKPAIENIPSKEMRKTYPLLLIDYLEQHIILKKNDISLPRGGARRNGIHRIGYIPPQFPTSGYSTTNLLRENNSGITVNYA